MYQAVKVDEPHCCWCLKSLEEQESFTQLLWGQEILCTECLSRLKRIEQKVLWHNLEIFILYEETGGSQDLIRRVKTHRDVELAKVFLHRAWKARKFLRNKTLIAFNPQEFNEKEMIRKGHTFPGKIFLEASLLLHSEKEPLQSLAEMEAPVLVMEELDDLLSLEKTGMLKNQESLSVFIVSASRKQIKSLQNQSRTKDLLSKEHSRRWSKLIAGLNSAEVI